MFTYISLGKVSLSWSSWDRLRSCFIFYNFSERLPKLVVYLTKSKIVKRNKLYGTARHLNHSPIYKLNIPQNVCFPITLAIFQLAAAWQGYFFAR
jgi:hypothetical protein